MFIDMSYISSPHCNNNTKLCGGVSSKTKRSKPDPLYSRCALQMMSFVDCIYTTELEIKDTTDTDMSTSYPDLHFEPDSGVGGY